MTVTYFPEKSAPEVTQMAPTPARVSK